MWVSSIFFFSCFYLEPDKDAADLADDPDLDVTDDDTDDEDRRFLYRFPRRHALRCFLPRPPSPLAPPSRDDLDSDDEADDHVLDASDPDGDDDLCFLQ
ncbi:hypothetical protein BaRGS_00006771 [Batillaria attramentaria]|uniref:Secreted protein n=1 Tax=Batillaria attramentaria TaxID=370345 RepID=A0ABD0LR33_9CAEN